MQTTMTLDLTRDSEHRYWRNGIEVPGVTRILRETGLTPPYPEDRGWLAFGKAVHRACELLMKGRLQIGADGKSYPGTSPLLWPYINGVAEKIAELRIRPIGNEEFIYHDLEGYAGQLDLHCYVLDGDEALIDLKTGAPPPSTALQLALYDLARSRQPQYVRSAPRRRYSFYAQPNRCIVKYYDDPLFDNQAALGAVHLWKWKYGKGKNGRKAA